MTTEVTIIYGGPKGEKGDAGVAGAMGSVNPIGINGDFYRQALINGSFTINQRRCSPFNSSSFYLNNDGQYTIDRWALLSDGNNVATVQAVGQGNSEWDSGGYVQMVVVTPNKKFGLIQILPNVDSMKLYTHYISTQIKAWSTAGAVINNIRMAILGWAGTAEAPTLDVVSAWNSQGQNPTLVTNWNYINTPANLALSTSVVTTYKIENLLAYVAGMTQLALFVWVDDTNCTAGNTLRLADAQLNAGTVCLPFSPIHYQDELRRCQRYWQKSYLINVVPGANTLAGVCRVTGHARSSSAIYCPSVPLKCLMRAIPIITYYRADGGLTNPNYWMYRSGSGSDVYAAVSDHDNNESSINPYCYAATGLTPGYAAEWTGHYTADAEIGVV
jgi:hypothetical protein